MASFVVLLKKELKHQVRSYRLLIVPAVFLFFGLGTPLLLKYMDRLLPDDDIAVVLPDFTTVEVAQEYLDTVGQVGLIAVILLAMGAVARERESGTAAMTLSKPVGSGVFVTAKLAALSLTFAAGVLVGGLGCYFYTTVLFGNPGALNFLMANLVAGLYLLVCLAITLMYSSFFKSQLAAGGLALVTLIALAATSGLSIMKDYSPGALLSWSKALAEGNLPNTWGALGVGLALMVVAMAVGWQVFRRKEI